MRRAPVLHATARAVTLALSVLAATACRTSDPVLRAPAVADSALLARDVAYLASDALQGRGTGTPGNDSAAAFIERRFRQLGLRSFAAIAGKTECEAPQASVSDCGYRQKFVARPPTRGGPPPELPTANVVALIAGTDSLLRRQWVVIGAHFDHLGTTATGALDPDQVNAVRNGADDNASGTATVLELARLLRQRPLRRSVAVVTFSGEELGLLGSQYFVEHAPFPLDSVQAMLNFDMVGRLRGDKLIVYGVATATELPEILRAANTASPTAPALNVSAVGDGFGPSDHSSFYARNIPVLHFFTDLHEDYHRTTDDADKVEYQGMARVTAFAERVARNIGDRDTRLSFVRSAAPVASSSSSRSGPQPYLGSIPDMGASDVPGLRLSGVRAGSPADQAGLKAGDVIVELAGVPVKDLYTYSDALYARQPGDTITIVAMRGGERLTFRVTLGRR